MESAQFAQEGFLDGKVAEYGGIAVPRWHSMSAIGRSPAEQGKQRIRRDEPRLRAKAEHSAIHCQ